MRLPHLALSLALCLPAAADSVSLLPSDDTALFETYPIPEAPDVPWRDYNFGGQRDAPVGTTAAPTGNFAELPRWRTRGLLRFDVAAAVPAGSTITAARLRLAQQNAPDGGGANSVFELRRVLLPWIEGDKRGENPGGAPASPGEPTWSQRQHPDTPWGSPGGLETVDYSASVSASTPVAALTSYTFEFGPTGIADLQDMLDQPGGNHGWLLKSDAEEVSQTARRFYLKETLLHPNPARRGTPPILEIEFSPPPDAPVLPPPITMLGRNFQGDLVLIFPTITGARYGFEVSTDLANQSWTEVDSFVAGASGPPFAAIPSSAQDPFFVRIRVEK